ncbi:glycosyltransferase family 2 protein [Geodermatophilus sp. SYSU D00697]
MSGPLVSILVPTYNGERFLEEALLSALAQTHRELEVVVGDDASTDRTPEILAAFAAADPRVRVLRHEQNLGPWDNPVALLREARGEYVKFLLHDDVLAPTCVEVLLEGLRASPGVTLAFSHRAMVDEEGRPVPGRQVGQLSERAGVVDGRYLGGLVLENTANVIGEVTTVLFRRRDVDPGDLWRVDGRLMTANGDIALWLDLLSRGDAYYTPQTLSSFRLHGGQQTQNPRVVAGGARDWPLLIDWGRRQGFLPDPAAEARAHTRALATAAGVHASLHEGPHSGELLEAVFLSTARLVELRTTSTAGTTEPLSTRAHGAAVLARFTQELDVWSRPRPLALATLTPDATEVAATVAALREVSDAGVAQRLVVAARPDDVAAVVPLVEDALTAGLDIDLELVPADDAAGLLSAPWLAVTPRGSSWHRGRADAVWTFDVPAG